MTFVRGLGTIALTAALTACSGNIGGGQSTLPGTPQSGSNMQSIGQAEPTATPVSASNVATLGQNGGPQPLPAVAGWGGTVAFANPTAAPSPAPGATSKTPAADAGPASVGITASVVAPTDAPRFGTASKRRAKHDPTSPSALFYITLLATSDVTFGRYPKFVIDVPRTIAAKHRDDVFALALYDPEEKTKRFRLAAAARDLNAPSSAVAMSTPAPTVPPTPSPTPTGMAFGPNAATMSLTPPPVAGDQGGLPPESMTFLATEATLTLRENRPVVFALYVVAPAPPPSPTPSASGAASPLPSASASPSPASSSSPAATATSIIR